jgi:phospholipid/cholesterol/gamma-HCH transport system substrate-binding protein
VRWLSRVVTLLIVLAVVGGGAALIYAKIPNTHIGKGFPTYAFFRDASRLAKGSPVRIAGVRVGEVTALTVRGELARVDMHLEGKIELPVDSWITKRAESAFGDNYIEIIPGGGEGAANAQQLQPGEPITRVMEGTSTDALLRGMARAMPQVDHTLEQIHDGMTESRAWISGTVSDRIADVGRWLDEDHLGKPLDAADLAMQHIEDGATSGLDRVSNLGPGLAQRLDHYNERIAAVRKGIADAKAGLGSAMANVRDGIDQVDKPIDDFTQIMAEIDQGHGSDWKGTLGRLINDPELADSIEETTISGRNAAQGLVRLHSFIGLRAEYDIFTGNPRAYATAEIRARNDKYYLVEFETGPLGGLPTDQLSDAANSANQTRSTTITSGPRYTFEFGKQFGFLGLRGGIKESTFGLGADMLFFDGRLKLATDIFGAFDQTPRLKVAGAIQVFRDLYILGGVDDALNSPKYLSITSGNASVPSRFETLRYGRDYFLGAQIQFDDEDLGVLLRVYGALILGLIH